MTDRVALITANFGGIDDVKRLPRHDGLDAFYYTDEATRAGAAAEAIASWSEVRVPRFPRHDFSPRLRSRYFKLQCHRLDEVRAHRWLVWADSSLQFHETSFILEAVHRLRQLAAHRRMLLVPHPARQTIAEEYEFVRTEMERGDEYLRARYTDEKLDEQMDDFRRRGWSDRARLYCSGFFILENGELFRRLCDEWWDQNLRFGLLDQLSLPPLLESLGIEPQLLDVNIYDNAHFAFVAHRA